MLQLLTILIIICSTGGVNAYEVLDLEELGGEEDNSIIWEDGSFHIRGYNGISYGGCIPSEICNTECLVSLDSMCEWRFAKVTISEDMRESISYVLWMYQNAPDKFSEYTRFIMGGRE